MANPKTTPTEKKRDEKQAKQPLNTYAKYSVLGFQMAAFVLVFGGIGYWLDERYQTETPWYTVILSLLGVFGGLYVALRDFIKKH